MFCLHVQSICAIFIATITSDSLFYLFGLENYGTVLSTKTIMQNPQLKIDGKIVFTREHDEISSSEFCRAWRLGTGPLILKICNEEYYSAVKLRQLFTGRKLNEMYLVDVEPWKGSRRLRHLGALSPRFPGTIVEFCDGTRLPLDHLSVVFNQIEIAVRSLHSVNLVHCDIKPSNIFLDNQCNTYLGDFGSMTDAGDSLSSFSPKFWINEISPLISTGAHPIMDWGCFVITGLCLLGKLRFSELPCHLIEIKRIIDIIKNSESDPAHLHIVRIFDYDLMEPFHQLRRGKREP